MPTYVLMTKLSSDSCRNLDYKEEMGRTWYTKIKKSCPEIKWLHHYAILGPFDFMDIYEADDEEEAAKVAMITMANGAVEAETWPLITYNKYLNLLKDLQEEDSL